MILANRIFSWQICDPPVSVYKGCSMPKDTENFLRSQGLKNAVYSIRASDLTDDLFGTLVACPLQVIFHIFKSDNSAFSVNFGFR